MGGSDKRSGHLLESIVEQLAKEIKLIRIEENRLISLLTL
jgi:hypothetical protein